MSFLLNIEISDRTAHKKQVYVIAKRTELGRTLEQRSNKTDITLVEGYK